ncbi:MAG: hypothetical protein ACK42L_01775 [Thermoanaerobaculum sp.]
MRGATCNLASAVHAAQHVVGGKVDTLEVFCRRAESFQLTADRRGLIVRREATELGVACRVQKGEFVGFGRASGSEKEAGREAARLASVFLSPGHGPLPAAQALGAVPVPSGPKAKKDDAEELFSQLARDLERKELTVTLVTAETLFFRSEGFTASWGNQLFLVEWQQEVLPGVVLAFRRAGRHVEDMATPSCLKVLEGGQRLAPWRRERGLLRVLLAPDVAAPLLVSLARRQPPGKAQASPPWDLWDLRQGGEAFLPMACDGEGYPAQNLPVLMGEPSETPRRRLEASGVSRGAVRVPWDAPPAPHPVHLWQPPPVPASDPPLSDFEGVMALAPVSEVVLESDGRFRLLVLAVESHAGKIEAQGVVVLSGSLTRLSRSLVATFGPQEHVALGCVVSTPWLFFKNLEVS